MKQVRAAPRAVNMKHEPVMVNGQTVGKYVHARSGDLSNRQYSLKLDRAACFVGGPTVDITLPHLFNRVPSGVTTVGGVPVEIVRATKTAVTVRIQQGQLPKDAGSDFESVFVVS